MTKLYWRERDADQTPCAFRYSKNCNEMAVYDRVHQITYVKFFDRRGLSWLNLEDIIPVCRTHMEDDKEYIRRYGVGYPVMYAVKRAAPEWPTEHRRGDRTGFTPSLIPNEQNAGR